jgi:hypothetical protein
MSIVTSSRRTLATLAGVAVIAVLAAGGCTKSSATPQIIYITPPPGPTGTPAGGAHAATPAPAAASPTITSVLIAADAPDARWKVTFKKPVVAGVSDAVAGAMNDAIGTQVNGYIRTFTDSGLPVPASGAGPSTLEGDYSIALNSPTIISLRFSVLTYTSGAAHLVGMPGGITFVVATGKNVALTDLFTDPAKAVAAIAPRAHAALSTALGTDLTWDGTAASLDFFSTAWVFTPAGLEFSWTQGQIASMAAGRPTAVVAWSDLKSVVKPGSAAAEFTK